MTKMTYHIRLFDPASAITTGNGYEATMFFSISLDERAH